MAIKTYKDILTPREINNKLEEIESIFNVGEGYLDRLFRYGGYMRIMHPLPRIKKLRFKSRLNFHIECLGHLEDIGNIAKFQNIRNRKLREERKTWLYNDFIKEAMSPTTFQKYMQGDHDEDVIAGMAQANTNYIRVNGNNPHRASSRHKRCRSTRFYR